VLFQKVGKGGAGQFLKALARFARDGLDRLQGLVIELHALPDHAGQSSTPASVMRSLGLSGGANEGGSHDGLD
jgi:hypothetical protein